jgi:hypothetical protein
MIRPAVAGRPGNHREVAAMAGLVQEVRFERIPGVALLGMPPGDIPTWQRRPHWAARIGSLEGFYLGAIGRTKAEACRNLAEKAYREARYWSDLYHRA